MKFEIGQIVQIGDAIVSEYCGQAGTVVEVMPHQRRKENQNHVLNLHSFHKVFISPRMC